MCVANTWFKKRDQRKVTFRSGENETEIDYIIVGKGNRRYLKDVKVIPWYRQHRLVVTDFVKRTLKRVIQQKPIVKRQIWKLKDSETRRR